MAVVLRCRPHQKFLATFAPFLHGSLPILEFLSIRTLQSELNGANFRWVLLACVPVLLSLALVPCSGYTAGALNVTTLGQIAEISNTHSKPLAHDCPNRENLAILRQANSLDRLRGLYLQSGCKMVQDITQLLNCLVLPALEELVTDAPFPRAVFSTAGDIHSPRYCDVSCLNFWKASAALSKVRAFGIYGITKEVLQAFHWSPQSNAEENESFQN
ncbi:hypothetical protein BT96DRAFT_1023661 [Gymnopus androsaceus JB14]|uniref:Uncharacterized protein n=1 Tax=Gymnopus androsaceus JB14 TaxID=1447944 RepID=A0A6A4H4P4_9AGAR|nr:hypothetical protein BT96DRAFT_1023661 [Gymnopus androsaceus JB14]